MSAKELYNYLMCGTGSTAYDPECPDQKKLIEKGLARRRENQDGEPIGILDALTFLGPQTYENALRRARMRGGENQ